jgi:hypothetical protein
MAPSTGIAASVRPTKESDVYDRQIRLWGAEAQVHTNVVIIVHHVAVVQMR